MIKKIFFLTMVIGLTIYSKAQSFVNPESIVYDTNTGHYFVSNIGNNTIVKVDKAGNITDFVTSGLNQPKGVLITGDTLVSANNTAIHGYSIHDASLLFKYSVTGAQFMNDITADGAGNIYISDMNKKVIFKMNLSSGTYEELVSTTAQPNGVLFNAENNTVLICYWGGNAKIQLLDLSDNSLTDLVKTKVSNLDGLARDNCGNIYVSSWGANAVLVFEPTFENPPTKISLSHNGPADISIEANRQLLLIPNYNTHTIDSVLLNVGCAELCQLATPENGSVNLEGSIELDWEDLNGASSYIVEYSQDRTFYSSTKRVTVSNSEYTVEEIGSGLVYYWRVRPVDAERKSMFTKAWSFETKAETVEVSNRKNSSNSYFYPNPASNQLSFSIVKHSVKLINSTGQIVLHKRGRIDQINISDLEPGMYFVETITEKGELSIASLIKN